MGRCGADITGGQPAGGGGTGLGRFLRGLSRAANAELVAMSCSAGQVGVAQFYLPAADEECAEVDDQ